jgi:hypothetical protein
MTNKVEFSASAHNLLFRKVIKGKNCQFYQNMTSNVQVSLQAARKKCFTSLDLEHSQASNMTTSNDTPTTQKSKMNQSEGNIRKTTSIQGLIGNTAALKQPTHE